MTTLTEEIVEYKNIISNKRSDGQPIYWPDGSKIVYVENPTDEDIIAIRKFNQSIDELSARNKINSKILDDLMKKYNIQDDE